MSKINHMEDTKNIFFHLKKQKSCKKIVHKMTRNYFSFHVK